MLLHIVWDPMREIIKDIQPPVWYSVLFALGFIVGYQIMVKIFKTEGKDVLNIDTLTVHMVLATIIGARLGHLVFYEPQRFLADPLMFFRTWEGGLASHGAVIGIPIALYLYSNYFVDANWSPFRFKFRKKKREGQSWLWILDRVIITIALAAVFIRMGNFVNSEIIGKPTESDYGVVFGRIAEEIIEDAGIGIEKAEASKGTSTERPAPGIVPVDLTLRFENSQLSEPDARRIVETNVKNILTGYSSVREHYAQGNAPLDYDLKVIDRKVVVTIHTWGIARHPAQLYESATSLILFFILLGIWMKYKERTPEGILFGIFLVWVFALRFFHETFKENQVAFEEEMTYNMGQILSIPPLVLGVFILIRVFIRVRKSS